MSLMFTPEWWRLYASFSSKDLISEHGILNYVKYEI